MRKLRRYLVPMMFVVATPFVLKIRVVQERQPSVPEWLGEYVHHAEYERWKRWRSRGHDRCIYYGKTTGRTNVNGTPDKGGSYGTIDLQRAQSESISRRSMQR